jgi:SAM-dependent methyltransferase
MTRSCGHVTGIDFSHAFIGAANRLREALPVPYERRDEAHLKTILTAMIPEGVDPAKTTFLQGDAMHLPDNLGTFDRVHAANLICRLTDPELFLARLPGLLNPGGELVLATPCTWLGEFTAPEKWPGGNTLDWLKDHLGESFELASCGDEPFLIRETARKFQWTRSMLTVWRKR